MKFKHSVLHSDWMMQVVGVVLTNHSALLRHMFSYAKLNLFMTLTKGII